MTATIQTILKPTRARGLDTSGNNNHAQIYSGRALEFDGVGDYLSIADSAAIKPTENVTIACWVKLDNTPGWSTLWGLKTTFTGGIWLAIDYQGELRCELDGVVGHANFAAGTSQLMQEDTWYRVVMTYDSSSGGVLYQNGVAVATTSETGSITQPAGEMRIGDTDQNYQFEGKMSDFQLWNSTWTAADAEYDYLNPEQLALNRGGTSLTNSNLKLWYPMNEGHRGDESYILDASNTGLGDNVFTNGDFATGDLTGWTTSGTVTYSNGGMRIVEDGYAAAYQAVGVAGTTYKLTYDVIAIDTPSGGSQLQVQQTGFLVDMPGTKLGDSLGTHSIYFTADRTNIEIKRSGNDLDVTIDNLILEPINNKHNATTVFYGEELNLTANNRTFAGGGNWAAYNSGAIDVNSAVSGKMQVTVDGGGTAQGAQLTLANMGSSIVAGRTYRVQADLDFISGSDTDLAINFVIGNTGVAVKASDGSPSDGTITTTEETYYADIVAGDATGALRINCTSGTNDSGSNNVFTVDNVSVKEVGIATGWTDADQQLDIPQTALQSYNQLAYFYGEANQYAEIDSTIGSSYAGDWSISFWLFEEENNHSYSWPLGADSTRNILTKYSGTRKLHFRDSGSSYHLLADYTIPLGKWNHIVVTATGNTSMQAYINGQQFTANSDMSDTEFRLRRFMQGYGTDHWTKGSITEIAYYTSVLTKANVLDLYNDGKGKSALEAGGSSGLTNYWRNNGLAEWENLKGTLDANCNAAVVDTMLITAGVDSSRDSQGFLMNRQRLTNSLNFLKGGSRGDASIYDEAAVVQDSSTLDITGDFTISFWVKFKEHATASTRYNLIMKKTAWNENGFGIHQHNVGKAMLVEYAYNGDSGNQQYGSGTNSIDTLDVWYHVCFTHEDSVKDAWYVTKSTSTTLTNTTTNTTAGTDGNVLPSVGTNDYPLVIGQGTGGGQAHSTDVIFPGEIDDVCIYNGKALTSAEVLRNFNAGKRSHK